LKYGFIDDKRVLKSLPVLCFPQSGGSFLCCGDNLKRQFMGGAK
jgi:hypothetical protein